MLVNLTPHALNIRCEDGTFCELEPSGDIARVAVENKPHLDVAAGNLSIPTTLTVFGEVEGLPAPQDGVIFIASALVAARAAREDVLSPGELIREEVFDDEGEVIDTKIVGCRGLSRHA